jgi:FMN phosphatase YigB (HAD superfamily)
MNKLLVILDFDGTFTDVEIEGKPFVRHYRHELAGLLGRDIAPLWTEAERRLDEGDAGWDMGGRIVAPANCDPYIRSSCIAFTICDNLALLPDLELRTDILQAFYKYCYRFTTTAFRPDAKETLLRIQRTKVPVCVVTNSDPDVVRRKLEQLGVAGLEVVGNARKYVVDPDVESVAGLDDVRVPSSRRPLLVRRPHYQRVLDTLWAKHGVDAAHTLVCGDILELDLMLPLARGAMGHLLERPNMLAYEREALAHFGSRATSSPTLSGLADRVEALLR